MTVTIGKETAFEVLASLKEARQRVFELEATLQLALLEADRIGDYDTVKEVLANRDSAVSEEKAIRAQIDRMTEPAVRKQG